jgi:hypothetical protein
MSLEDDIARAEAAQQVIVQSPEPVFVKACPGAGKTRVLVDRSLRVLAGQPVRQGVAILSFSNSAVDEVTSRFGQRIPAFPSFIGTFDSFLWRFLIAPFGAADGVAKPRLIPDLGDLGVSPTKGIGGAAPMREFPLRIFAPDNGQIRTDLVGDDARTAQQVPADGRYQARARRDWERIRQNGLLDYEAARKLALQRIGEANRQPILQALAIRFAEVLIDEAQDCNPADLRVVQALRDHGVRVSVIGDFDQAIYGFRHGAPPELDAFAETYPSENRHELSANFRSVDEITRVAAALRRDRGRFADTSLVGPNVQGCVTLVPYRPRYGAVSSTVAGDLEPLLETYGIDASDFPIVAHSEKNARRAAGLRPLKRATVAFTVQLASAVAAFHAGHGHWRTQVEALNEITALIFRYWDLIPEGQSFHQVLSENDYSIEDFRRQALTLAENLKPAAGDADQPRAWIDRCKEALARQFPDGKLGLVRMPSQQAASALKDALLIVEQTQHPISTIHQVKGQEFPGICVVVPPSNLEELIRRLENNDIEEAERVLYVGITRAMRVCAIALPDTIVERFRALLERRGAKAETLGL